MNKVSKKGDKYQDYNVTEISKSADIHKVLDGHLLF